MALGEIVRVRALVDLPAHDKICPPPKRGNDVCGLDQPPMYNNEEFRFVKGEVKILPVNTARHFQKHYREEIVVEGEPINMQNILELAAKDPKNLEAFMKSGELGKPVEVRINSGVAFNPGEPVEAIMAGIEKETGGGRSAVVAV